MQSPNDDSHTTLRSFLTNPRLPKIRWLAAAEQTRLSWAIAIESYEKIPVAYKNFFDALPPEELDPFPFTTVTPTFKGFRKYEYEKLVCCLKEKIYVLEKMESHLETLCYPIEAINYIEFGTMLLHAWVTINGETSDHELKTTTLKCNSVTDYLLTPIVEMSRPVFEVPKDANLAAEIAKFNELSRSNYKFMNFAKRSIREGERIIQTILQPRMRTVILKFLDYPIFNVSTPAHLTILTNHELIVIRDDESQNWQKGNPHGAIWNYISLNKIDSISLTPKDNLLQLTVQLPGEQRLSALFEQDKQPELEALIAQIEKAQK